MFKDEKVVYVEMRYPKHKGMTEIKAYLKNEGSFIWEDYFNKKSSSLIGK
ncbi:Fe3+ hydroxamate ABC transporter substrate-binding protein [Niallia nealsonii]|nr:Fe3+ hydroxamate ABC transporter substrate-binding protein [Niallia nealsonii]